MGDESLLAISRFNAEACHNLPRLLHSTGCDAMADAGQADSIAKMRFIAWMGYSCLPDRDVLVTALSITFAKTMGAQDGETACAAERS